VFLAKSVGVLALSLALLVDLKLPEFIVVVHQVLNLESDARIDFFVLSVFEQSLKLVVDIIEIDQRFVIRTFSFGRVLFDGGRASKTCSNQLRLSLGVLI
jgi:hypothetical protein